jgi:hypothetical protein
MTTESKAEIQIWEYMMTHIRNSTMSLTTLVLCFFYLSNILLGS